MKKILAILSLAVVVVACKDMYGPASESTDTVEATAISLTVTNVTDESFDVTLSPSSEALYYSYVVMQSAEAEELDPALVYSLSYSGVEEGIFKYSDKPKVTFTVTGLKPNTAYQVYAVSSSSTGVPSEVAVKSVLTSDGVNPAIAKASYDDETCTLTLGFSEAVSYVEGKAITVKYYAGQLDDILEDVPVGTGTVDKVSVSGNTAEITFSGVPAGAHVSVSYEDGAFADAVGNPIDALTSGYTKDEDGELDSEGLCFQRENVEFELSIYGGEDVEVISDLTAPIWMSVPEDVTIASFDSDAEGTILYEGVTAKHEYVIGYGAAGGYGFGWNGNYNCALTYPNAGEQYTGRPDPNPGEMLTITIPPFLTDIYGNTNAEFVIGPALFSYGFTVDDIIGTYQHDGTSGYGASYNEDPWTFTIAASDDEEKGNVMLTSYYGFECAIYGEYDGDLGELTFPIYFEELGGFISEGALYLFYTFAYYSCSKDEQNDLIIYNEKPGVIAGLNDYPGYYYEVYSIPEGGIEAIGDDDYLGNDYNIFSPSASHFGKVEATSGGAAPAGAKYYPGVLYRHPGTFTRVLAE